MPWSSFVPLAEGAERDRVFRPLVEAPAPETPAQATVVAAQPMADEPRAELKDETQRAFQAGYALGRDELRSQIESVGESFVKSLEELAHFRTSLRDRYERELLELALGVARKVVREELVARPEIWLGMIRAAVRHAVDRERIVVRVPATLAAFLRERSPELRKMLEDVKEIEVAEDPALPADGCVIESRFGEVDIGVDTQLEAIEHALVRAEE